VRSIKIDLEIHLIKYLHVQKKLAIGYSLMPGVLILPVLPTVKHFMLKSHFGDTTSRDYAAVFQMVVAENF